MTPPLEKSCDVCGDSHAVMGKAVTMIYYNLAGLVHIIQPVERFFCEKCFKDELRAEVACLGLPEEFGR